MPRPQVPTVRAGHLDVPLMGQGPHRVLCLHGWFGSGGGWGWLPEVLDGTRFTYAFPDSRGYGLRRGDAGTYTTEETSVDVLALADALGWTRFSLVGHSMGGKVAQRVLVDAPDRVDKVVALNPVPASAVPFDERGWRLFAGAVDDADKRRLIVSMTTGGRLSPIWVEKVVRHSLEASDPAAFSGHFWSWARSDFSADVKGIETPVLVLTGEHDPALGAPVMEDTLLQWFPNARLEVIANAGHYPMFETPVTLATTIEAFLSGPEPS